MMRRIWAVLCVCLLNSLCWQLSAQEQFAMPEASTEAKAWYEKGDWKQGFMVDGFEQIDVQTFYEQYRKAPQMWDSIFAWLGSIDPVSIEPSKNAMQWSHAYVKVLDQTLRTPENCQWEQHQRTIDLQWDVTGCERYHLTRMPETLTPLNEYNEKKDVQNFKMNRVPKASECLVIDSEPTKFYLFFPGDIHQACGIGKQPCLPRKIVVKIDYL